MYLYFFWHKHLQRSRGKIWHGIYSLDYSVELHFQQYFSCIRADSFIGGGDWSTWRTPLTCCKSLTYIILYRVHHTTGFKLTMLVVIATDCIGSYKSNYHTITTTTARYSWWEQVSSCFMYISYKTHI